MDTTQVVGGGCVCGGGGVVGGGGGGQGDGTLVCLLQAGPQQLVFTPLPTIPPPLPPKKIYTVYQPYQNK